MAKSVFEQIKKQNGERFAKAIRGYDNGIFDIPGIVDIVKYAGREAEPIMDYLESLKQIHIEETGVYQDPLTLLDVAGYDAYYVTNLEEQNAIQKYYATSEDLRKLGIQSPGPHGEALCTFRDPTRFERYHIINAVRKDVDQIRREDFKGKEDREDKYGTSVLSIQILKTGGFISIKNRYNHTVDNPDNTLNSNPDRIIPGLANAIRHHFNTDFSAKEVRIPHGYMLAAGQIIRYNSESENIYFGSNFYFKDGSVHPLKSSEIMLDQGIFDIQKRTLTFLGEEDTAFKEALLKEIEGHTLQITKDKEGQHLSADGTEILTVKEGCITSLNLPTTTKLGEFFMAANKTLKTLNAPNVTEIERSCLHNNEVLEKVNLERVETIDYSFCPSNENLETLVLPALKSVGDDFLYWNTKLTQFEAPLLEQVGDRFLDGNNALQTLLLPSLKKAGFNFLSSTDRLTRFEAPLLEELGYGAFDINSSLTTLDLPSLKSVGDDFLKSNRILSHFEAPCLETVGERFLGGNEYGLKSLSLPSLKKVKERFLKHALSLEHLYAPLLEPAARPIVLEISNGSELWKNRKVPIKTANEISSERPIIAEGGISGALRTITTEQPKPQENTFWAEAKKHNESQK